MKRTTHILFWSNPLAWPVALGIFLSGVIKKGHEGLYEGRKVIEQVAEE